MRIGFGYDVHKLTEGRKCIICGVDVPHTKGLLGHSDADVAIHALNWAIECLDKLDTIVPAEGGEADGN